MKAVLIGVLGLFFGESTEGKCLVDFLGIFLVYIFCFPVVVQLIVRKTK